MASLNVSYGELNEQASRLANARHDIENQLAALKSQVNALLAEGFVTDTSSKAFQAAYDDFTQGAAKTVEGLDAMANYLRAAAQTFQEADQQVANVLRGM